MDLLADISPNNFLNNQRMKRRPKTVKGYLNLLRRAADIPVADLQGYEDLADEQRTLGSISADIYNTLGEFDRHVK